MDTGEPSCHPVVQGKNDPTPGYYVSMTSLYDASQGRNGGGNINAILKSGTKTFHGDLYEFFRNDVLNANEYFLKGQGGDRPVVKQNIFGASLGGPIGKDAKLGFFFANYQGTRQRSGLSRRRFPVLLTLNLSRRSPHDIEPLRQPV